MDLAGTTIDRETGVCFRFANSAPLAQGDANPAIYIVPYGK